MMNETRRKRRRLKDIKVAEGSLVDKGANEHAKVVFFKRDGSGSPRPGWSEKDERWNDIQMVFDDWMEDYHEEQDRKRIKGDKYKILSREQLITSFLTTPEGAKLYNAYQAADDVRTPVQKAAEAEPRTLEEYAWRKLEKIAKKYHKENDGITIEKAHLACMNDSFAYREVYYLGYGSPLAQVDFTQRVSKSLADAVTITMKEIDQVAEGKE